MCMNRPLYLGLSILELSKILLHEFWYGYEKQKYGEKAKLYYMDIDNLIVCMETDNIFKGFAENVEARTDTSNYELDIPLPRGKNKKVTGLMRDEWSGKIMIEFIGLRAETYSYLMNDGSEDKKAKGAKKCVIKRKLEFENCENCLEATQLDKKMKYR